MDASTGKITLKDKGEVKASFDKTVANGGFKNDIPGLWTLPFNTKAGVVTLTAVIDGKTFQVNVPEVEVKQGWQYIFRLALTNSGLEFDPSKTETLSLNVTTDGTGIQWLRQIGDCGFRLLDQFTRIYRRRRVWHALHAFF